MSDEHLMAKRFANDLDKLVRHPEMFRVDTEDEEYTSLLLLAQHLMGVDFSIEVDDIDVVMKRIASGEGRSADLADDKFGELSEDELDNIAAAGNSYRGWRDLNKKE